MVRGEVQWYTKWNKTCWYQEILISLRAAKPEYIFRRVIFADVYEIEWNLQAKMYCIAKLGA